MALSAVIHKDSGLTASSFGFLTVVLPIIVPRSPIKASRYSLLMVRTETVSLLQTVIDCESYPNLNRYIDGPIDSQKFIPLPSFEVLPATVHRRRGMFIYRQQSGSPKSLSLADDLMCDNSYATCINTSTVSDSRINLVNECSSFATRQTYNKQLFLTITFGNLDEF